MLINEETMFKRRAFEKSVYLLNLMETSETNEDFKMFDTMIKLYDKVALPNGDYGNTIALALATGHYTSALRLISKSDQFDLDINQVSQNLNIIDLFKESLSSVNIDQRAAVIDSYAAIEPLIWRQKSKSFVKSLEAIKSIKEMLDVKDEEITVNEQNVERLNCFIKASDLIRIIGLAESTGDYFYLDMMAGLYKSVALPDGTLGNAISLALATNHYVAALHLIDEAKSIGLDTTNIAHDYEKSLGSFTEYGERVRVGFIKQTNPEQAKKEMKMLNEKLDAMVVLESRYFRETYPSIEKK